MCKPFVKTLTLLLLFAEANCFFGKNHVEIKEPEYEKYIFTFSAISFVAIIRYSLKRFKIPIPYSLVSIILASMVGTIFIYAFKTKHIPNIALAVLDISVKEIYLPLAVFSTSFCIDVHSFLKSLPQILVISVPAALTAAAFVGVAVLRLLERKFYLMEQLLYGIMLSTIHPVETLRYYRLLNLPQLRQVVILLEGETVVTIVICLYVHQALTLYLQGWTVYWYHYVMGLVRFCVIGIPTGCLFGYFGSCLMKMTYNDNITLTLLTIAMCYTSFSFGQRIASSGALCTSITGIIMSIERTTLPPDSENFIKDIWLVLKAFVNYLLYICVGTSAPLLLETNIRLSEYLVVLLTYALCNLGRFLSFIVFAPALRRMGYGLTLKNLFICVWLGIKSPIILDLSADLESTLVKFKSDLFYTHAVLVYLLYLLINVGLFPIILRLLGILDVSVSRQINMNNCMRNILQAREKKIAILKMDRFLSDANWPLVISTTVFEHPYKSLHKLSEDQEDEEDIYHIGMRFSTCPDCKQELLVEPTPKELRDMKREARMRILKLKKIYYSRLYENGMISKEGVRNLHNAVQTAMDTEEALIHLDGILKLFNKEGFFYRFIRDRFIYLTVPKEKNLKVPRKHWRLTCYRIIRSPKFKFFVYLTILLNTMVVLYEIIINPALYTIKFYMLVESKFFVFFIFFIEFWLTIFGYSWIYVWQHGFKEYFTHFWNILSFAVMLAAVCDLALYFVFLLHPDRQMKPSYKILFYILCSIRISAFLRFFQLLTLLDKCYNKTIKHFDTKIDKHRAMAYELGKNYLTVEEELLENLVNIIDHDAIREELRQKLEEDKEALTKVLGLAQKDRSKVAVSVKTKLVMQSVLNSMRDAIQELKISGWVDEIEHTRLMESLTHQCRYVKTIKVVPHPAPSVIFKEISWMGDDTELIKFLYDNVTNNRFEAGQVVCGEDENIEGIYVLITGLLKVDYKPKRNVMNSLNEAGILPIVDYISTTQYDETISNYIVTGNCIGELSILTQRPYNCTITAECHSQVYVLKREILQQAMNMDLDPIKGLECRIWQTVSVRIAIPILMNVPAYRSYTQEQIRYTLERSFMPNITNFRVFVVNEMMEDVILIEGVVIDYNTKDVYTAPCYVPRSVQKLILPKSSVFNMEVTTETRMLIIPAKDVNEYDIMIEEESICELVSKNSSKCLQNLILKYAASKRSSKTLRLPRLMSKRRSRQGSTASTTASKSRITLASSANQSEK